MKRIDKIRALQQALGGNLKPLLKIDQPEIVAVIVANKGVFEIVELHPTISPTQTTTLQELKESVPLFYD
jgi:energy-converting hydrogenase A subunit M